MALDQYKTQVLLLHSEQRALDTLSAGWSDKYSVHVATSGTEALHIFNETPVHVIVSAHDLPGMSGLDALREAKKRSPDTIGILLAGNNAGDDLEALVGDKEVFQVVRGDVTADGLQSLIDAATTRSRILALAESANDLSADVDQPVTEHIVMETSENGSTIISDGTGQMPVLKPEKISIAADSASSEVDVLVLTKDEDFLSTIRDSSRGLHNVHHCVTPSQATDIASKHSIGVLVTDAAMVGSNIEVLTQRLRQSVPRLVAVVAGRRDDGELLMDLINRGQVYRFLLKPVSPGRARLAIEASVKHHLEAADSAFKQAAAQQPAPAPKAAKPTRATRNARKQAPPATGDGSKERSAGPISASREDSLATDRLDDAFDDDRSFTETITGLALSIGKKFTERSSAEPAPRKTAPTMSAIPQPEPKKAEAKRPTPARPSPAPHPPREARKPAPPPAKPAKPAVAKSSTPAPRPAPQPAPKPAPKPAPQPAPQPALQARRAEPPPSPPPSSLESLGGDSNKPVFIGIVAAIVVAVAAGAYFLGGSGEEDPLTAPPGTESVATPSIDETDILPPPADTEPSAPLPSRQLTAARDALADGRLIAPPGDNAVELYVAALAADPGNAQATAELDDVIEQVVGLAESAILETRLDDASNALQMIELGSPDNPRLAFLNAQLDKLQLLDALDRARLAIVEDRFEDAGRNIERAAAFAGGMTPEIELLSRELASARSAQRVDEVLEMATARLEQGQLITPSNNNARYYYELALGNDPGNAAARQGLIIVASRLVGQARAAIDAGQFVNAEDLLRNARGLDPTNTELAAAAAMLEDARAARARAEQQARDAKAQAERQARDEAARLEAERAAAIEAARLEAERAAAIEAEEERRRTAAVAAAAAAAGSAALPDGSAEAASNGDLPAQARTPADASPAAANATETDAAPAETPAEPAGPAAPGAKTGAADAAMALAALNPTAPSAADAAATAPAAIETVPMSQLERINYVSPKYPRSAQRRNITGSVDLSFTVRTDGTVRDVEVTASTPGSTFDKAAIDAVSQWLFEPTIVRGRPVERRTAVRLAFNLQ